MNKPKNIKLGWSNAAAAVNLVKKERARGNLTALTLRGFGQTFWLRLSTFQQRHCVKCLVVGMLVLCLLCVGIKRAEISKDPEMLWQMEDKPMRDQTEYTEFYLGPRSEAPDFTLLQYGPQESNMLTRFALNQHLKVLQKILDIEVHLFESTWRWEDVCVKVNLPSMEIPYYSALLGKLIPCYIISPLDCFWEGSLLLGPRYPLIMPSVLDDYPALSGFIPKNISWQNLNPQMMFSMLNLMLPHLRLDSISTPLKEAGMTTGYMKKPCLNPFHPRCPSTAPNYKSHDSPTTASWFTGGCEGIASKYMHWREQDIIGGATYISDRNITGAIALQSTLKLPTPKQLFNEFDKHFRVSAIQWNIEKAAEILKAFQRKITDLVYSQNTHPDEPNFYSISYSEVEDNLAPLQIVPYRRILLSLGSGMLFCFLAGINYSKPLQSRLGLTLSLISINLVVILAALGVSALLGLNYNSLTIQLLPFLSLALTTSDGFYLLEAYREVLQDGFTQDTIGCVMKEIGNTLTTRSITKLGAFLILAAIPQTIIREFAFQMVIVIGLHGLAVSWFGPVLLRIDYLRVVSDRADLFCCKSTVVDTGEDKSQCNKDKKGFKSVVKKLLKKIANNYHKDLRKPAVRFAFLFISLGKMVICFYGVPSVTVGFSITEFLPQGSQLYKAINIHSKLFGDYRIHIVTEGDIRYESRECQELLRQLHHEGKQVDSVVKDDTVDGGQPFWLDLMAQWLTGFQILLDSNGYTHEAEWMNSSDPRVGLAYKLVVQTGNGEYPIDKTRLGRVKLVDKSGIINSEGFYNYLSAWRYSDTIALQASQGSIEPEVRDWTYIPADPSMWIPRAPDIKYSRLPFKLNNLHNTTQITKTLGEFRALCVNSTSSGLPCYPSGFLYSFYYPLLITMQYSITVLASTAGLILLIAALTLTQCQAIAITVSVAFLTSLQTIGLMGWLSIELNNYSVCSCMLILTSNSLTLCHVTQRFQTMIGNPEARARKAIEASKMVVVYSVVAIPAAVAIRAAGGGSLFMTRSMVIPLCANSLTLLWNSFMLLPTILLIFTPPALLQPHDPEASQIDFSNLESPPLKRSKSIRLSLPKKKKKSKDVKKKVPSRISLSTISEESTQHSSTIHNISTSKQSGLSSHCSNGSHARDNLPKASTTVKPTITTTTTQSGSRITTTATVSVEVHTEIPISKQSHCRCQPGSNGHSQSTHPCQVEMPLIKQCTEESQL